MTMTIRTLIAKAIQEAQNDFAKIIEARLHALMGTEPEKPSKRLPSSKSQPKVLASATKTKPAAKSSPTKTKAAAAKPKRIRNRTKTDHVTAETVYQAISRGQVKNRGNGVGKKAIMSSGRFHPNHDSRVGIFLIQLREEGRIVMSGSRRGSTYKTASKTLPKTPEAPPVGTTTHEPLIAHEPPRTAPNGAVSPHGAPLGPTPQGATSEWQNRS